jgi:hypothetical protein
LYHPAATTISTTTAAAATTTTAAAAAAAATAAVITLISAHTRLEQRNHSFTVSTTIALRDTFVGTLHVRPTWEWIFAWSPAQLSLRTFMHNHHIHRQLLKTNQSISGLGSFACTYFSRINWIMNSLTIGKEEQAQGYCCCNLPNHG